MVDHDITEVVKPLRQLFEEAETAVEMYKHPDIAEAQDRLNEILIAAGLGSTGGDEITHWCFDGNTLNVGTRYSVCSCEQDDSFNLPVKIIDAADPLTVATLWGLQKKRDKAYHEVKSAKRTLAYRRTELVKLEDEISRFKARATP